MSASFILDFGIASIVPALTALVALPGDTDNVGGNDVGGGEEFHHEPRLERRLQGAVGAGGVRAGQVWWSNAVLRRPRLSFQHDLREHFKLRWICAEMAKTTAAEAYVAGADVASVCLQRRGCQQPLKLMRARCSIALLGLLALHCGGNTSTPDAGVDAYVPPPRSCNRGSLAADHLIRNQEDLEALAGFTEVQGNLRIEAAADLVNLEPLSCLRSVIFSLDIRDNDSLTSLVGLNGLESVGFGLSIEGNDLLPSLDALGSLTSVGTGAPVELSIRANDSLNYLGLDALSTLGGNLVITNNIVLPNCWAIALAVQLADESWFGSSIIENNDESGSCSTAKSVAQVRHGLVLEEDEFMEPVIGTSRSNPSTL